MEERSEAANREACLKALSSFRLDSLARLFDFKGFDLKGSLGRGVKKVRLGPRLEHICPCPALSYSATARAAQSPSTII